MKVWPKITTLVVAALAIGLIVPNYLEAFIVISIVGIAFMIDVLLFYLQNHIDIFEWFLDNIKFWDPEVGSKDIPESIAKLIRRGGGDKKL